MASIGSVKQLVPQPECIVTIFGSVMHVTSVDSIFSRQYRWLWARERRKKQACSDVRARGKYESAWEVWEICEKVKRIIARGKWQSVIMRGYKSARELRECKRAVRICERYENAWEVWVREMKTLQKYIAWQKSRHLATLPLVSPPKDVWETSASAEIPYWWRFTT